MNTFYHGDCLFVMNHDIEPNSIDLIYLDPPFFTGKIQKGTAKWQPGAMEVSYEDSKKFWGDTEKVNAMRTKSPEWLRYIAQTRPDFASYLFYMMERLDACRKVLNDKGSIYLHCDEKASHYLKMIMDEIFGCDNYKNEIIWHYGGRGAKAIASKFPKNHDVIIYYTKGKKHTFNRQHIQRKFTFDEARKKGFRQDSSGIWFKTSPRGDYTDKSIKELESQNRIHKTQNGNIRIKYPLTVIGELVIENVLVGDTWIDIADAMHIGKESVGYPTQKPLALLERIIKTSSNEGDIVLDPFCGCGTAIIEAQKLNRQWIGIDISKDAYNVSKDRYHQLPLGTTFGQKEANYVERTLDDVLTIDKPAEFEHWVNGFFGATKPMPDRGVDGITQDGIPIQTKTFVVTSKWLRNLLADAILHKQVKQPCKHAILVSQKGFDDTARQQQFEIKTKEGIKVDLLTPSIMLKGDDKL